VIRSIIASTLGIEVTAPSARMIAATPKQPKKTSTGAVPCLPAPTKTTVAGVSSQRLAGLAVPRGA
jgi:hypothetical protein